MNKSLRPGAILLTALMALDGGLALAATILATCVRLADIPEPSITFPKTRRARLALAQDLFKAFSRGEGELVRARGTSRPMPAAQLQLHALPWGLAEGRQDNARLVVWHDKGGNNDDNMRAITLNAGESWCTPKYDIEAGSRLRFEGLSLERAASNLTVTLNGPGGGRALTQGTLPFPGRFAAAGQKDASLEPGPASICFRAEGGAAAIGEARLLAPERAQSDSRPRWIVLTIEDGLRGDVLRSPQNTRLREAPALSALARGGHEFTQAISPGCHTRAAVWPVLMGRDLMRIDPLMRRQSMPNQAPLTDLYSRANLFITHVAEAAGYHTVFLGNNAYFRGIPAFGRLSSWGTTDNGTFDTIKALPDLFERYGDERLLLLYYITAPHTRAHAPRRLFEAFGCAQQSGMDQCRCAYRARVRHADEALEQLQRGLEAAGLEKDTFQVVTADHGELFEEGLKLEGEIRTGREVGNLGSFFESFGLLHGRGCHALESDVPLVVHGEGVRPRVVTEQVSGLDVFPTLLDVLKMPVPSQIDGVSLPLSALGPSPGRRFVSYGFCSDSVIVGKEQFIWWLQGCDIREPGSTMPLAYRSEFWSEGRRVATDQTDPTRLEKAMAEHETWLRRRLPAESVVFGLDRFGKDATLTIEVQDGIITDFGPARTVDGLGAVAVLDKSPSRLTVRLQNYDGLYYISTLPPRAPVRFDLRVEGKPTIPLTLVGPMQIPLDAAGRWVRPGSMPQFFLSSETPTRRQTNRPALRLWWQPPGGPREAGSAPAFSEFDRVLREWGYIR
ncbi:MAG: sulfatase-like hydrolase/transferase [Vicinamibacteria bacterium]|nr:sulfatase-like hydrolase/transferase [Vicinamibacteria bacterium]